MAVDFDAGAGAPGTESTHHADLLEPFIQQTFDPVDYLNATLPSLSVSVPATKQADRASLTDLNNKTQVLLSDLNAQTSRLSNSLTQLTDEIIRSGSRLAYEVEILNGETTGLSETLLGTLHDDIALFGSSRANDNAVGTEADPEHIDRLRTLTHVRSRLESVIKVFGEAMSWPLAPSELSSSIMSVTAPNVTPEEIRKREEKGKEAAQKLRDETLDLLQGGETPEQGLVAAMERLDALQRLSGVWKGTAEEKARTKFIDGLSSTVEDQQRKLSRRNDGRRQVSSTIRGPNGRTEDDSKASEASYGFMNSLRKIRE